MRFIGAMAMDARNFPCVCEMRDLKGFHGISWSYGTYGACGTRLPFCLIGAFVEDACMVEDTHLSNGHEARCHARIVLLGLRLRTSPRAPFCVPPPV